MTVEMKATDIVTPPCRLSFPSLFEKSATFRGSDDKKYQASLLLPPEVDLKPFYACMEAAMLAKFGKPIKLPASKNPVKNCDEKDLDGYDEGWHYINCKSGYQPNVLDQKRQEILDPERIFAGCWVRMHLSAFAWDHPTGGRGISFSLNSVQLVREGERLDGRRGGADVFEDIEVEEMPTDTGAGQAAGGDAEGLFG